ncbi:hypothetical protein EV2_007100 [Malus domestica]
MIFPSDHSFQTSGFKVLVNVTSQYLLPHARKVDSLHPLPRKYLMQSSFPSPFVQIAWVRNAETLCSSLGFGSWSLSQVDHQKTGQGI